tara:strand:- start:33218 stop:34246 length:1029 start_codon:yes stop_codon:yes gene_type:complete
MDCFFAAIEIRDQPLYQDQSIAVGGTTARRGVISTCNYLARSFGVKSAMPTAQALKLCPKLIVLPTRMETYREVSGQIRLIFERYTSLIEPLSLDEAYLDVSECSQYQGSATLIAQAICQAIQDELQLTASAGVAHLKFLAKIASDINKPHGLYVIPPNKVQSFVEALPLEKIPGVGRVTLKKLHQASLFTCKDIKQSHYPELIQKFGRFGVTLWQRSHAIDERSIQPHKERKSIGVERTLAQNIESFEACWEIIQQQLYPKIQQRLKQQAIHKVGLKIKFADFQVTTIEQTSTHLHLDICRTLLHHALKRQKQRQIRLMGMKVTLKPSFPSAQIPLFELDT